MLSKWLGPGQSQKMGPIANKGLGQQSEKPGVASNQGFREEAWSEVKLMLRRQGRSLDRRRDGLKETLEQRISAL